MATVRMICIAMLLPCLMGRTPAATSDWPAVQSLAPGERIQVDLATGKTLHGNLDHVTDEALYVQNRTRSFEIRRDQISRVYRNKKRNWTKSVLIGAVAGAAVAGIEAPRTMEHEPGYGGAVAGTVALGALVGAGIGRLVRGSGQLLVYEVKR